MKECANNSTFSYLHSLWCMRDNHFKKSKIHIKHGNGFILIAHEEWERKAKTKIHGEKFHFSFFTIFIAALEICSMWNVYSEKIGREKWLLFKLFSQFFWVAQWHQWTWYSDTLMRGTEFWDCNPRMTLLKHRSLVRKILLRFHPHFQHSHHLVI